MWHRPGKLQRPEGRRSDRSVHCGESCSYRTLEKVTGFGRQASVAPISDTRRLIPATRVMRRPERVADIIREEISQIVGYELEDPRLTMVTVTDVRLSENRRDAQVFVTVAGNEEEHRLAVEVLLPAAPSPPQPLTLS